MSKKSLNGYLRGAFFFCASLGFLNVAFAQPAATAPSSADSMFHATTLNLSAYGEVEAAPDMATITLGVTSDGPTAAQALAANSAKMTQVVAALRRGGIPERDIQTSGINLNPQYVYQENQPPRLTGYQVSNQVTVVVRDLTRIGAAVDATVNAGATNVNGISFGLQNPQAAEDQARMAAVRALTAKSELYARAINYRVSRLITLSEGGGYQAPPPMPMMAMREQAANATPVSPGQVRVRIDITGVYELTR
jgi:uncharacterized protein YggE